MKPRARRLGLVIIAIFGVAAIGYQADVEQVQGRTQDVQGARPAARMAMPAEPPSLPAELKALLAAQPQPVELDLFAAKSWHVEPPPPPPPPPAPPPPEPEPAPLAPSAPPLPFTFMGKMISSERQMVFLVKDGRAHMVAEGDVIDGMYKLEKIESGQLTLRYLPLETVQTLVVGEVK